MNVAYRQVKNSSVIPWREEVKFISKWCCLVCSRLTHLVGIVSAISLLVDRHGDSHIIMIPSQPVFVLMLYCRVLSRDATHINSIQLLITKLKMK